MSASTRAPGDGDRGLVERAPRTLVELPVRLRLALRLCALQFGLLSCLRLAFFIVFRASGGELAAREALGAVYVGLKFDLRLALFLTLPLILCGWIRGLDPLRSERARRAWLWAWALLGSALLLFYIVDFAHYDYLHERVHAGVLDQVLSPGIAAGMVWETYPVLWGLLGLALFARGWGWLLARLVFRAARKETPPRRAQPPRALPRRLAWAAFGLLVGLGIYGKLSWYPLRWSDAYAFENPFAAALALNPLLFFADSFPDRQAPYDEEAVRAAYDEIATLLEVDRPDRESLDFTRRVNPDMTR